MSETMERCPTCGSDDTAKRLCPNHSGQFHYPRYCTDPWHTPASVAPVPPSEEPYFVIEQGDIVQCFGPDADAFVGELLMRLKRGDKLVGSDRISNGLYVEFERAESPAPLKGDAE